MNLGDIHARVQRIFGDESGAQITVTDITRWANEAQLDIVRKSEILQRRDEISSVAGTADYGLPRQFVRIRRVTFDGRLLIPSTFEEVDQLAPDRQADDERGIPSHFYVWANRLYLYPIPEKAGTTNIDVWYIPVPIALVDPPDVPEVPEHLHDDIVRFALSRAKELDEEYEQANIIRADYDSRILDRKDESHQLSDSYPAVRTLPEDSW